MLKLKEGCSNLKFVTMTRVSSLPCVAVSASPYRGHSTPLLEAAPLQYPVVVLRSSFSPSDCTGDPALSHEPSRWLGLRFEHLGPR